MIENATTAFWDLITMDKAGDYLTVLQLGVALNLVAGAYTSNRKDFEYRAAEEIGRYRDLMAVIVRETPPDGALAEGLESKKEYTDRDLDRYLHDVSNRFDRRSFLYARYDKVIEIVLIVIGLACAAALIIATTWPDIAVNKPYGICLSIFSILPPAMAFLKTSRELRTHNLFYRRRQNESRSDKESVRNEERSRSKEMKGEIHRAINKVRLRIRSSSMNRVDWHEP